jgi:phosphoribosylamine-glycine ligase
LKILCIDATASFLDFALRAEAQGHEVRVFMGPDKTGNRFKVGDGLLKKVPSWQSSMKWADLILASDNCKYMRELEAYRKQGFPIFTSNVEVTSWELDRQKGQDVLKEAGIECLPSIPFKNLNEAIAHQKANWDVRYVCKPSADVDKALSYVSKGARDMLFMLQHWKKHAKTVPFIFQEFCPGIEVAVGGWVGRNGFLSHFLENFEFKKLMSGDWGPNTGEQGTVMKYCTAEESKLAQELLLPLEARLIREGFTGYIDVAVMVGLEGKRKGLLNPLEFTCRHGWPLFQIQQVLHPDVCNWMLDALEGRDTFQPAPGIACGVVCAIPEYPFQHVPTPETEGFPIFGIDRHNRYNFHPCEMMLGMGIGENGEPEEMLVTAGSYACVVTGTGPTVSVAKKDAYENLGKFEIPNSPMVRDDIGDRLEKQLPILQKYGYCTSWVF